LISKNIKNISTASFTTPVELHKAILEWARKLGHDNNAPKNVSRFIFRYTGPDYVGLIAKISEVVFGLSLNIDYISHAARSGLSTIYMSCSTYAARKDEGAFRRHLEKVVHKAIKKDLAVAKAEGRDFAKTGKEHVSISVDPDHEPSLPYQFYVELRTIDTPGQLHFICKVIRDTIKYNIDEIVLKPTQREHERQTTMSFWLSKRDSIGSGHPSHELMELELQLRALIGVQSLTTELIYQSARNQT
jgi:predicted amino acid-binding ACT domain protein